jgi:small-conductance mechanosensitive channel
LKTKEKFLIIFFSLIFAIGIPILILFIFNFMFAEFYSKGFLNGIAHMFIGLIMIIVNAVSLPVITFKSYKKKSDDKKGNDSNKFILTIVLSLLISVFIQIVLSILIENPF